MVEDDLYFADEPSHKSSFCKTFSSSVFNCAHNDDLSKLINEAKKFSTNLTAPFIGHTLWDAVKANRQDVISSFVAEGASVNMCYRGETMLHEAVKTNNPSMIKFLLSLSDIEKDAQDTEGVSPLMIAARGLPECLKVLLIAGCDVNKRDNRGNPAMHQIFYSCYCELSDDMIYGLNLLVAHGADINSRCGNGMTCLHKAVEDRVYGMVGWLVFKNANPNISLGKNYLPHLTCCQRQRYYDHGLSIEDHPYCLTPLFFAIFHGNRPILDLLMSCGCAFREFAYMLNVCAPTGCVSRRFLSYVSTPTSLKSMCRTVIRGRLSSHICSEVKQLGLPLSVMRFVMCLDEILTFNAAAAGRGRL